MVDRFQQVDDNARVCDNAQVYGDVRVSRGNHKN
jgi:hypothetical protein